MLSTLFEGVVLGVTLAFLVGPGFVALIQTSIHRGFIHGVQFAVGVVFSDFALIALSYLGALQLLNNADNQFSVGLVGGIILIIFGVVTTTRKSTSIPHSASIEVKVRSSRFLKYFFKGFFMNIFNPFLLIFWMGMMGLVTSKHGVGSKDVIIFFSGALSTVFLTDLVKCFIAHKIKRFLNVQVLTWLNRIVGILLIVFGIVLIVRVTVQF